MPLSIALMNACVSSVAVNVFFFSPSRASISVSVVKSVKALVPFSLPHFTYSCFSLLLAFDPYRDGVAGGIDIEGVRFGPFFGPSMQRILASYARPASFSVIVSKSQLPSQERNPSATSVSVTVSKFFGPPASMAATFSHSPGVRRCR